MVTEVIAATVVTGASVATAFFNHQIGAGQYAVAKNFFAQGRKIRPIAGLCRRSLWNDAGNDLVSLPEFHRLTGSQPGFQALGVAKLANVYARHSKIVSQDVTRVKPR